MACFLLLKTLGVLDVRLDAAAPSLVVHYDSGEIAPGEWDVLLRGDAEQAGGLIDRWLSQHGHRLYRIQTDEECNDEREGKGGRTGCCGRRGRRRR
jgi:hypothetical protein